MLNWLYLHIRSCRQALVRLWAQPLGTLLSAMVVGIALSLPAAGYVLLDNVALLARGVSGTPEISVFMADGASAEVVEGVQQRLRGHAEVASYRQVTPEEALADLGKAGLGDVLGGLERNPLPQAFVVTPRGDDPEAYDALRDELAKWEHVQHVQLDSAWVQRLHALLRLGQSVVLLLAVLLGFALVIVTFNTIRLQILTQRQEIDVSRLLGAEDAFIRRPFLWFGSLQGILGGLVAVATVWAAVLALSAPVAGLAASYGAVFMLSGPGWQESLWIIGFAGGLGWLGSAISVRRHLAEKLS